MIRVAVFGGDGRGYRMERADERCVVTAYEGDASNAERVAQATRSGSFTHVVALKRWMNHPQWHKLHDACKESNVLFVTWTRGLGSLKSEIEGWIFKDQVKPFAPLQKNGLTKEALVAEVEVAIDACEEIVVKEEKTGFQGITTQLREAFLIDPKKEWTIRALSLFLYDREDNRTMKAVAAHCLPLERQQFITCVGGVSKSTTNPRRLMLKTASVEPTPAAVETPLEKNVRAIEAAVKVLEKIEATYAALYTVMNGVGNVAQIFTSKEEALAFIRQRPDARLFREVKMRVTVEIDE